MAKSLFIISLCISLTICASQERLGLSNDSISQMLEPDNHCDADAALINKASEWAVQCLNGLSAQDRATMCKMLEISYLFSYTDLKLKRAIRIVFDISCGIQDKLHRFIGITEDTALLKKMAVMVDDLSQEYNNKLVAWQQFSEKTNQEKREGLLEGLRQVDVFAQAYVNEYVNVHQKTLFEGLEIAIVDNLKQGELVKTIHCSLLDSLNSKELAASDYTDLLESSFQAARLQFCAEVKSIWKIRRLFVLQELLLGLRKEICHAFYQAARLHIDKEQ